MFAIATHVFSSFFSGILQVFQTYVTSVLSRCCKSRSGVAHITIRVRSGGGASPYAWSGGTGVVRTARAPRGCAKYGLRLGRVGLSARSAARRPSGCPDTSTVDLYLPFFIFLWRKYFRSIVGNQMVVIIINCIIIELSNHAHRQTGGSSRPRGARSLLLLHRWK
jgi:hypothetical protein